MKKFFKILSFLFLGLIIIVFLLIVAAKLSEDKIAEMAIKKVGESIEAPVAITDVSFNLLRKFPYATIELNNIYLGTQKLPNQTTNVCANDTIISLGKIYLAVKTRPLINGIIEIVKVKIQDACLVYSVNTKGQSNIDFLLSQIDTTKTDTTNSRLLTATLKELSLENINCLYSDSTLNVQAGLLIPKLTVSGAVKGDSIAAKALGSFEIFDASYPKAPLHLMERTKINLDATYVNDSINLKNLLIDIDGAKINSLGHIIIGEDIFTDLKLSTSDFNLAKFIKYAPSKVKNKIGLKEVRGNFGLNADVKGKLSKNQMPAINAQVNLSNGYIRTTNYPEIKNLHFAGKATNGVLRNMGSAQAVFNNFHFETENSNFNFAFSVHDFDCFRYNINSECNININDFRSFIPDTIFNSISGKVNLNLITKGILPDSITNNFIDDVMANSKLNLGIEHLSVKKDSVPEIKNLNTQIYYNKNHVEVKNLTVSVPDYRVNLKNTLFDISYSGSVNNYKQINIDSMYYSIETDSTKISGNAKVKTLGSPQFNFFTDIALNINEFAHFVPDTVLANISGKLDAQMYAKGKLDTSSISKQITDILFKNSQLNLNLKNIDAQLPDGSPYGVANLNGLVKLNKSRIHINKLSLDALGVDIAMDSTTIDGFYESIIKKRKNEQVLMQTNISLGTINYESLISQINSKSDTTKQENQEEEQTKNTAKNQTKSLLPNFAELGIPHFLARGKIMVNQVIYEQNILDDVFLKFRFTDSLYVVDNFKLKTCDGILETSAKLEARGKYWDSPIIDLKNTITDLNLDKFLVRNEKYTKPKGLTNKNLSGVLSSEIHARVFYKDLIVNKSTEKIRAKGSFVLEKGKLYDFEPLKEASISLGGLKELDKLDFSTIETGFFMFKDKIYIPKTDVVTNALDLSAFAMHGLTKQIGYEYHLGIHLGDVLAGKSKKLTEKQKKEGGNSVKRNSMDIVSMKTPEKKKNGLDTEKQKSDFRKRIKRQESFLNLLFDPRLVNFSTDLDRSNFVSPEQEENN